MDEENRQNLSSNTGQIKRQYPEAVQGEDEAASTSANTSGSASTKKTATMSATKKSKSGDETIIDLNPPINYRILNLLTVLTAISEYVKCKTCDGDINFKIDSERGLGFKILLQCSSCPEKAINSCPLIANGLYEINHRFIFALRMMGNDLKDAEQFCALMDIPRPNFRSFYDSVITNISDAAKTVCNDSLQRSATEEQQLTATEMGNEQIEGLTVCSNNQIVQKLHGAVYGISTVIGYYSKRILDMNVASLFCEECEEMGHLKGTFKHENWWYHHKCPNNIEAKRNMAINGIFKIFKRSVQRHNTKYVNYIAGSDKQVCLKVIDKKPYGDDIIKIKHCINFARRQMGNKLLKYKKKHRLDGGDMLTMELIDELTLNYYSDIYEYRNSYLNMKRAIWSSYLCIFSTDQEPNHYLCPEGENSWCEWQQAKARGVLENFTHTDTFPRRLRDVLKPIYEDLTKDEFLEMCVGGFEQDINESCLLYKIASYNRFSGYNPEIVDIAANVTTCIINDGYSSLIKIMNILNINIGPNVTDFCRNLNLSEESDEPEMMDII